MTRAFTLAALALLAACQRAPEPKNDTVAATPTPAPTPAPSPAGPDLSRYVGAYPLDTVDGGSFLAEPAVRRVVEGVVNDPAIRERVLGRDVTATPIVADGDRLLSYGCEPHNCGPHNWTIAIRRDGGGGGGAVCYYDQDANVARWYPAGAGAAPTGGCPFGDD